MSNSLIRDVIIIGVFAVGSVILIQHRDKVYAALGIETNRTTTEPVTSEPVERKTKVVNGSVVSIPKSRSDGHFWTDARVNHGHVKFLVDTGASSVALTLADARKAGIRDSDLEYNIRIQTAGGENRAAQVTLKSVSVGPITLRNVKAIVVKDGLSTSLLGMTYLGELQKVEATRDSLVLRL